MQHPSPDASLILCPTDFSRASALALTHAAGFALHTRRTLTLLHIRDADEPAPTRSVLAPVADLMTRWGRLDANARYRDFAAEVGFEAVGFDVPARSVADGVLSHLEDHPVDLAVLATEAHKGLAYWFAGSLGRRALRRALAMILFIREGQRGVVDPATGSIRLQRALIPVDGRIDARLAIARACALIDELAPGVEKRLLHIGATPPAFLPPDLPLMVREGPVVETILRAAKGWGADLIVMPTAGRRGVLAAFRNSVTARILEDARWPVLSVPAIAASPASAASP